jgi:hypothetical protein
MTASPSIKNFTVAGETPATGWAVDFADVVSTDAVKHREMLFDEFQFFVGEIRITFVSVLTPRDIEECIFLTVYHGFETNHWKFLKWASRSPIYAQ